MVAVLFAEMQFFDKHVQISVMAAALLVVTLGPSGSLHDAFDSRQAYAYTAEIAGFGERWPGSPGHKKTEDLIRQVLQRDGA